MVDKKIQKQFKELLSRECLKMTSARLAVLDDMLSSDDQDGNGRHQLLPLDGKTRNLLDYLLP